MGWGSQLTGNDAALGGAVCATGGQFVAAGAEIANNTAVDGAGVSLSSLATGYLHNTKVRRRRLTLSN